MATVPRCDGIPLPEYRFYDYKKVMPNADGLTTSIDYEKLLNIVIQNISTTVIINNKTIFNLIEEAITPKLYYALSFVTTEEIPHVYTKI